MVQMIGITKRFPGIIANDNVTLTVQSKEIHALLGENGAGKSTLMSILTGLYRPDEGEILIKGGKVDFVSPKDAVNQGIGMVHQHFKLVKPFTVAENIMLGLKGLKQVYKLREIEERIVACSQSYGLAIDPKAKIWQLSVGEQQRVEIIKLLFRGAEILILDEPTAVLTPQESGELYKTLRTMADMGKAVIVISHKMNEVMEHSDRITILRGGKSVETVVTGATNENELARLMVGREVARTLEKKPAVIGRKVLDLKGVSALGDRGRPVINGVSLDLYGGEIVGIAGVAGNGQTELAEIVAGLRQAKSGQVLVNDTDCTGAGCKKRSELGISYVPEDRMSTGLVPNLNAFENMILKSYRKEKRWLINWKKIRAYTDDIVRRFDVKLASVTNPVKMMSGGNMQKLLLAREIESEPSVIVAVYPMRGLDIGATEYVRKLLLDQRDSGRAVLLISEELEELLALSDRIAVMHGGEVMGVVDPLETTIEEIGMMMAGRRAERHAG